MIIILDHDIITNLKNHLNCHNMLHIHDIYEWIAIMGEDFISSYCCCNIYVYYDVISLNDTPNASF